MEKHIISSITVSEEISLREAMQRLSETALRILFVAEKDGKLIGTITDGDLRTAIIDGMGLDISVSKVMNRNFKWVSSDSANYLEEARHLMLAHKIEQIPILKEGLLKDIVLLTDIFGGEEEETPKVLLPNRIVIMAGGKGTRLDPFTKILPKPLIPLGDKPIIEIIMGKFYRYGFHKFLFTLNYKKEYIKMFLKESDFTNYEIGWVEEATFMGTAGSLSMLKGNLDDTFFVSNCDIILDADYADILRWHKSHNALITVVGCHKAVSIPYGILNIENGYLKDMTEKPGFDFIINTGVYVIEPSVIELIGGGHMDMNTLIELAVKQGNVSVYPVHEGWFDTGQWEEYRRSLDKLEGRI